MPVHTNIEDLRRHYARRTPEMFYDYAESGSWTEQTFRENSSDFQHIHLKQRVAVDMSGRTTQSQMIGEEVAMPVALALGAKGTYIGRAFTYGLGAAGEAGVTKALEIIHKELDTTMALCGETDVKNLGTHNLYVPQGFADPTVKL